MSRAPVLLVGGLDSSGGAGLLRDVTTAVSMGATCRIAVTAVTAQSDSQVAAVLPMPPEMLTAQVALAVDKGVAAAKTGMLVNRATIELLAARLPPILLVVDPVFRSTSGQGLLTDCGVTALLTHLLPRTTLLTPNLPELSVLAARLGLTNATEPLVASALLDHGCGAVLVKGGHAAGSGPAEDRLYRPGQPVLSFRGPRYRATLRGTGCQLASGIVAGLAAELPLDLAIAAAKIQVAARFESAGGQT